MLTGLENFHGKETFLSCFLMKDYTGDYGVNIYIDIMWTNDRNRKENVKTFLLSLKR